MTNTEWKKVVRVLDSGKHYTAVGGEEIRIRSGRYGREYALYSKNGNCVTVEYDLSKIKELMV